MVNESSKEKATDGSRGGLKLYDFVKFMKFVVCLHKCIQTGRIIYTPIILRVHIVLLIFFMFTLLIVEDGVVGPSRIATIHQGLHNTKRPGRHESIMHSRRINIFVRIK